MEKGLIYTGKSQTEKMVSNIENVSNSSVCDAIKQYEYKFCAVISWAPPY